MPHLPRVWIPAILTCLLPLLVLAGVSTPAAAGPGDPIEVIELRHRPAAEMEPLLRPLLAPADALSVSGNRLILRTDPATLAEVRALLVELDRAPRNLLITVSNADQRDRRLEAIEGGISAGGRDERVIIGDAPRSGARLQLRDAAQQATRGGFQQLRVVEGQAALISAGQAAPITQSIVRYGRGGSIVQQSTQHLSADTGFYVRPRISGEQVTLEIEPQQARFIAPGVIESQRASTVVSGHLGEWIEIGGIDQTAASRTPDILSRSQRHDSRQSSLRVKVDLLAE